ncbi:MAG TPA: VWA domain-containing protein, partial [Polyangiaceae bacterium]|nr:VWA domain-containing protein [Polyangiaceae bacterium]
PTANGTFGFNWGGAIVGDHVAIVIDASASMSASEGEGRRIDAAKKAAHDVIAALAPGADALIVESGADARIASPLDRDKRRLAAAVDQLDARDVEGRLGRAVALATDRLRQLPGDKRLVVITDGALADPSALATASLPMDLIRVGSAKDNSAIVRVDVRDGKNRTTKRDEVQVFASVAHYGATPREVFVTLRLRNVETPLASRKLTLSPGQKAPVVLAFEPTPQDRDAGLIVEISPRDALPADDVAFSRVPAGRRLPVVLAPSDGNPWVRRALLADPDVDLSGTDIEKLAAADVPGDALVVVDGACPAALPGGDLLVLNPKAGRCRTATITTTLKGPPITSWATSDPRLRFLTLDGVEIATANKIEVEGPTDALVRTRDGAIISDISLPGRTGTLVAFDVGESNWPLKASFVLFMRNIVELARTHRARGITGPARTGQPLRVRVPPDVSQVKVTHPDEKESEVLARLGLAVVPEARRAGFYFASWEGTRPGSVLVAANLVSAAESDIRERTLEQGNAKVSVSAASDVADAFTDWAWLLALLALAFVVADAIWLTRKPWVRAPAVAEPPKRPERAAREPA